MRYKVAGRLFLFAGASIYAFDLHSLEELYVPQLEAPLDRAHVLQSTEKLLQNFNDISHLKERTHK